MSGDVAMPAADPQQALQLDAGAASIGASPALTRAGSRKRNRDETAAPPHSLNASATGLTKKAAPAGEQPTSNSIEETVRAAAKLAQSDPSLLAGVNPQDAAHLPKPDDPLPNGKQSKQARGKRAKPVPTQQALPSNQPHVAQPSEASLTDAEHKSKRAKVAQAVAAVKVMVEQEHTHQDPAIANAPLTEDHPTHRVSHAAAPPVVTAKPADAAPRITENFPDTTATADKPQGAASSTKAASKLRKHKPQSKSAAQSAQAEASDEAVSLGEMSQSRGAQASLPEPAAQVKLAPKRRQPASRKAGTLAVAVKADTPAESLLSPSREAEVPAQNAPLPETTAASRPSKQAGEAGIQQEPSTSESLQEAAAAQAAAVKKPAARSRKKVAAAAVQDLPSTSEGSAQAAHGDSDAAAQKAAPKPRRKASVKKASAPPVKEEEETAMPVAGEQGLCQACSLPCVYEHAAPVAEISPGCSGGPSA